MGTHMYTRPVAFSFYFYRYTQCFPRKMSKVSKKETVCVLFAPFPTGGP